MYLFKQKSVTYMRLLLNPTIFEFLAIPNGIVGCLTMFRLGFFLDFKGQNGTECVEEFIYLFI